MARATFRQYKNKRIYCIDYSNLKYEDEFLHAIDETNLFRSQNLVGQPVKSILMLVDLTNSFVHGNIFNRLKESGSATKPFLKKQAVVGLTPGKAALLKIFNLFIKDELKPFNTVNEALDWLIRD